MDGLHHLSTLNSTFLLRRTNLLYDYEDYSEQRSKPRDNSLPTVELSAFHKHKVTLSHHHGKSPTTRPHHRRQPRHRSRNRTTLLQKRLPLHLDLTLRIRSKSRRSKPNTSPIPVIPRHTYTSRNRNAGTNNIPTRLHRRRHISRLELLALTPLAPFHCSSTQARAHGVPDASFSHRCRGELCGCHTSETFLGIARRGSGKHCEDKSYFYDAGDEISVTVCKPNRIHACYVRTLFYVQFVDLFTSGTEMDI